MRLIVECEHGNDEDHWSLGSRGDWCWPDAITDPDAILAALAEAGVLEVEWGIMALTRRFVSPWKETK
jgi:hypothetical protein